MTSKPRYHRYPPTDGASRQRPSPSALYGSDRDDPYEQPGDKYVELVGGALDDQLVDVTHWTPEERATGMMLITNDGRYGPGSRAEYDPGRWDWAADAPSHVLARLGGPCRVPNRAPSRRRPGRGHRAPHRPGGGLVGPAHG